MVLEQVLRVVCVLHVQAPRGKTENVSHKDVLQICSAPAASIALSLMIIIINYVFHLLGMFVFSHLAISLLIASVPTHSIQMEQEVRLSGLIHWTWRKVVPRPKSRSKVALTK